MKILKDENKVRKYFPINNKIVKKEIFEATKKAEEIINEAQKKAEEIIREAKKKAEKIEKESEEKGYEDGLRELNQNLLEIQEEKKTFFNKNKEELIKLSLKISEKIIGREIKLDRKTILDIVENAIKSSIQTSSITIKISPKNYELLKNNKEDLMNRLDEIKEINIISDEAVDDDGCIIESEIGTVDARLKTQLKILSEILLGNE